MPRSVFVSHVYEDVDARNRILMWASHGLLGPDLVITGESEDVRRLGDTGIRRHLSPKLQGAAAVLVLVGDNTHNHGWIEYEIQHALSAQKRVLAVRIPGTSGAPPNCLKSTPLIELDADAIRQTLGS